MTAPGRCDAHVDREDRKVKGARTTVRLNAVAERPLLSGREPRARGLRRSLRDVRGIVGAIPS